MPYHLWILHVPFAKLTSAFFLKPFFMAIITLTIFTLYWGCFSMSCLSNHTNWKLLKGRTPWFIQLCNPYRHTLDSQKRKGNTERARQSKTTSLWSSKVLDKIWWKNHWQVSTVFKVVHRLVFIGLVQYIQLTLTKLLITFNKNQAFLL